MGEKTWRNKKKFGRGHRALLTPSLPPQNSLAPETTRNQKEGSLGAEEQKEI